MCVGGGGKGGGAGGGDGAGGGRGCVCQEQHVSKGLMCVEGSGAGEGAWFVKRSMFLRV